MSSSYGLRSANHSSVSIHERNALLPPKRCGPGPKFIHVLHGTLKRKDFPLKIFHDHTSL